MERSLVNTAIRVVWHLFRYTPAVALATYLQIQAPPLALLGLAMVFSLTSVCAVFTSGLVLTTTSFVKDKLVALEERARAIRRSNTGGEDKMASCPTTVPSQLRRHPSCQVKQIPRVGQDGILSNDCTNSTQETDG